MNLLLNLLLMAVGFVSVYPVIHLFNGRNGAYRYLRYLMNTTFLWTILIFVERFSSSLDVVYYAHLLGYPVKFLLATFMLFTIYQYIGKSIPKWQVIGLAALFLAEITIAVTNQFTEYILRLQPSDMVSFEDLYFATNGNLFYVHLALTYTILLLAITYLFVYLRSKRDVNHYQSISRTMTISVIVVLTFNALQLTVITSSVDLTYISLVIVAFTLYRVIYSKDILFNLRISGRGEILSNMREMYILMDGFHQVVEVSPLLCDKYNIDEHDYIGKPRQKLVDYLSEYVVLYTDYNINEDGDSSKDHFHLREKEFHLKGMDAKGYMALLYDETQVYGLLRELNKLSNYDSMTGLNNRNYMEQKLTQYTTTKKLGVISLDLNGLKINNDYIGHERGDFLLKKLATIIKQATKDIDGTETARIGGDEFLVMVQNSTKKQLQEMKDTILELAIDEDLMKRVSVSIGLTVGDGSEESVYDLIHQADQKMYEMKRESSKDYVEDIIAFLKKQGTIIR